MADSPKALAEAPDACIDLSRRRLARISADWERGVQPDAAAISFLLRMAEQRLNASPAESAASERERHSGMVLRELTFEEKAKRAAALGQATKPTRATEDASWPAGCLKPNSCARHRVCSYAVSCRHFGRDIRAEVTAAIRALSDQPAGGMPDA